jgi:hypothetical protein
VVALVYPLEEGWARDDIDGGAIDTGPDDDALASEGTFETVFDELWTGREDVPGNAISVTPLEVLGAPVLKVTGFRFSAPTSDLNSLPPPR